MKHIYVTVTNKHNDMKWKKNNIMSFRFFKCHAQSNIRETLSKMLRYRRRGFFCGWGGGGGEGVGYFKLFLQYCNVYLKCCS